MESLIEIDAGNYKANALCDEWCLRVYATGMCVGGVVDME